MADDDLRKRFPRLHPDVFDENMKLVREITDIANKKGCKPGQLAIAWILKSSGRDGLPEIIPIPGATTDERVVENSVIVDLTDAEFEEINTVLKRNPIKGARYPEAFAHLAEGNTPLET